MPCKSIPGITPAGLQSMPIPARRSPFHCAGGYTRSRIRTLKDLVCAHHVIQHAAQHHLPHPLQPVGCSDAECELSYLQSLLDDVPAAWVHATKCVLQHPAATPLWPPQTIPNLPDQPTDAELCVEQLLLARLGWHDNARSRYVSINKLTVKSATSLQLTHVCRERRARHRAYVEMALGIHDISAPDVTLACRHLAKCFRIVWRRIKWDNAFKEVFWRLVLDALPTAQRLHHSSSVCLCNVVTPGRHHHFWQCPIAQAVVQTILSQLPASWCSRAQPNVCPIQQKHVWLMQPPPGPKALHSRLWMVVCLSALNAMDCGRRAANDLMRQWHLQHAASQLPSGAAAVSDQPCITSFFAPAAMTPAQQQHRQLVLQRQDQQRQQLRQQQVQQRQQAMATLLSEAKLKAVARFWQLLADFVILNPVPGSSFHDLPSDHPFICRSDDNVLKLSHRL